MNSAFLFLAFSAGALTFFTPCAFLLPAYLSYTPGFGGNPRGDGTRNSGGGAVREGFLLGLPLSIGLLSVFLLIGLSVGFLGSLIKPLLPTLPLVVGLVLLVLGTAMFLDLPIPMVPHPDLHPHYQGSPYFFGVFYGLAAAGCSVPIFLSILVYALSLGNVLEASLLFLSYSLGISLPLIGVTSLWAGARPYLHQAIPLSMRFMRKGAALVLTTSGLYLLWIYFRALPPL